MCSFYSLKVRDNAIRTLVEIYRHVGEKVRIDLSKRGIPPTRYTVVTIFNLFVNKGLVLFQNQAKTISTTSFIAN